MYPILKHSCGLVARIEYGSSGWMSRKLCNAVKNYAGAVWTVHIGLDINNAKQPTHACPRAPFALPEPPRPMCTSWTGSCTVLNCVAQFAWHPSTQTSYSQSYSGDQTIYIFQKYMDNSHYKKYIMTLQKLLVRLLVKVKTVDSKVQEGIGI